MFTDLTITKYEVCYTQKEFSFIYFLFNKNLINFLNTSLSKMFSTLRIVFFLFIFYLIKNTN